MKKLSVFAALLLAVACGAMPVLAQDAKKAPPKPAPGLSDVVLEQWNDIGRKLIAMAEDFPEDKYNYKPAPESRTFGGDDAARGGRPCTTSRTSPRARSHGIRTIRRTDNLKTKAQIVAFVKQCVSDGAEEIKKLGDKGLEKAVNDGGPHLDPLYNLAYGLIEHSGEHYGALVVYYRNNGMVPPESRPKK